MTDNERFTPLHRSVENGNYEMVKFFVDEGADIFLKAKTGMNYLHLAATNGNLNLSKQLLNKHKIDVLAPDNDGFIPLHYSAENGNYELVFCG